MTSVVAESNTKPITLRSCRDGVEVMGGWSLAPILEQRAMAALKVRYKDPHLLKPRARNPRTHTAKQIKQIAASIKEFGFISPVLIDGADGIIAGHGRVEAAKLIGMSDVPTVRVDHLTPAQIRAYVCGQ
jgi:ParB-like nuclease domain